MKSLDAISWACNYVENPTDLESCDYPETYYDCEGECLMDTDGDGVCDELEEPGCTDEDACNYAWWATDDDGSCVDSLIHAAWGHRGFRGRHHFCQCGGSRELLLRVHLPMLRGIYWTTDVTIVGVCWKGSNRASFGSKTSMVVLPTP